MNPNNPTFQNAERVCYEKTAVQGFPGSGVDTLPLRVTVPSPGGNGGSGANG
jgi:hypothetical protein